MDMKTADKRTHDYFRNKMARDPANKAFWSATARVTAAHHWHLDQLDDAALDPDTQKWLEDERYFGATTPFGKDVVRRLVYLNKRRAQKLFREICTRARLMDRLKAYRLPGEEGVALDPPALTPPKSKSKPKSKPKPKTTRPPRKASAKSSP